MLGLLTSPAAVRGAQQTNMTDPATFLDQTEALRLKDHAEFAKRLAKIHREAPTLNKAEQWHLDYLDALEASLQGHYGAAEAPLRALIERSGSPTLTAKASELLMNNLAVRHRYLEAFLIANQLAAELPKITDPAFRNEILGNLSQMVTLAGQTDLAIKYAQMMEKTEGKQCGPFYRLAVALNSAKRITSSDARLRDTIAACTAERQPILEAAAQLMLIGLELDEHRPTQALATLDSIAGQINKNHYYPHALSSRVLRAEAYEQLGKNEQARQTALSAIAMADPNDIDDWLMIAYRILVDDAKRRGHSAAALGYYEQYVKQQSGSVSDAAAQALAYQTVRQQLITRKLEAEELSKQNSILKLQQALDAKAVETSRLYIALLLIGLTGIALWLFRTTRSQLRFKRMATRDGLTGTLNHQHFMGECERRLSALEKRPGHACLIWIDLDHFKQINDTHGHATGDAALRHSVAICQQQLRPGELLGRLGGEEFGILLGDCPREQAIAIADRIRLAIEASPMVLDEAVVSISASIGVATTATSGYDLQRLCRDADAALYRAKRAGRNRVMADAVDGSLAEA